MRDLNDDDDRLRSISGPFSRGLGQVGYDDVSPDDAVTSAVEVSALADQGGGSTTAGDAVLVRTLPANAVTGVQTLTLPQFNFNTGVESCTTCPSASGTASAPAATSALATNATSAANVSVTPLPAAPTTVNWLLLLATAGVAYLCLKSPAAGLGSLEEGPAPVPTEQPLGRPPRRPEPKEKPALKHLASLTLK